MIDELDKTKSQWENMSFASRNIQFRDRWMKQLKKLNRLESVFKVEKFRKFKVFYVPDQRFAVKCACWIRDWCRLVCFSIQPFVSSFCIKWKDVKWMGHL